MKAEDATSRALAGAAQALRESARQHKRAAAAHRRAAQADMQALERLRNVCEQLGIKLDIQKAEATSHGRKANP